VSAYIHETHILTSN